MPETAVTGRMPQQLVDYWVHGKGAAKIRWGTDGSFERCVRNLRKYFPQDPQGLCARLHKRATGEWPAEKKVESSADVETFLSGVDDIPDPDELAMFPQKRMWRGILAPFGVATGDRRRFVAGGITARDLPLPLLWQQVTAEGHKNSVVVGRLLSLNITDTAILAEGDWLDLAESYEAEQLVDQGVLSPSVDLDDITYEVWLAGTDTVFDGERHCGPDGTCQQSELVFTKGRVAGATLVYIPAFAEAKLENFRAVDEAAVLAAFDALDAEEPAEPCGCTKAAVTAAAAPLRPPAGWFADPGLRSPTPLTVTDDGQVFGHLATWGTCYVGLPGCLTPPRSRTQYAYFLTGEAETADGGRVPVGKVVVGGRHAKLEASLREAIEHYDDSSRAVAVVNAGEDTHGIWIAGAMLPGVDDELKAELMRSPLSGDWRRVGSNLELVAALAVNVPGFPVPRGRVGAQDRPLALVAAACVPRVVEDVALRWDGERMGPLDSEMVTQAAAEELDRREAAARRAQAFHQLATDLGRFEGEIAAGVVDQLIADIFGECVEGEFCRNPLHPGPCKGWKRGAGVQPGDEPRRPPDTGTDKAQERKQPASRTRKPSKSRPTSPKIEELRREAQRIREEADRIRAKRKAVERLLRSIE